MKRQVDTVDATPSKRLYLSIIADYDVSKAICELIDNAIDLWTLSEQSNDLEISISLDENQQRIEVVDNAGGVDEADLSFIVGPGQTGTTGTEKTIGIFGVGTKRAVVALAQNISIRTRKESNTYLIEFDDDWIRKSEHWHLPVYEVDNIARGTTLVELTKLRNSISDETISQLVEHLGCTYARFLRDDRVDISVNGEEIEEIIFEDWAYPPGYEPRVYSGELVAQDGRNVSIEAVAGLSTASSPAGGEYGVYFYCNDRLIARALKTYDVGFTPGIAGKPHADISLTRVIVSLDGESQLLPWNSSKSDINTSHEIFLALRNWLLQVVKGYSSLARRLSKFEGGWPENVFKYRTGKFEKVMVPDFPKVNMSYLPPLPEVRPRFASVVKKENRRLAKAKPWTIGLYESIIAVDWILKQGFEQKNRIALILLDSTLEIAFKEYLANELRERISDRRLQSLFSDRTQVHKEVEKNSNISQRDWKKIAHNNDLRNSLIHRRATASISDTQIEDFRSIVQRALKKLFKMRF